MALKQWWRAVIVSVISISLIGCGSGGNTPETESNKKLEGIQIEDGMAQPMLKYSDINTPNKDSEILRFCVYVETDHDTDGDGKADLVKAFVQLPRSAAEGEYKAAAIYDPMPYSAGMVSNMDLLLENEYGADSFDTQKLYEPGKKRKSKEKVDTLEHALNTKASEYNYKVPGSLAPGYSASSLYDYYLIRGFAIVDSSGIGTYGSEGYELCSTDLERDSHKAVVEWLAGNRKAFTDKENNIEIEADWCNHNVAMIGGSYGGAITYEVATTGVEGLKTVISFAGIADWYNYSNSQGAATNAHPYYSDLLAAMNAGNAFLDDGWFVPNMDYIAYLKQIRKEQTEANGNYDENWDARNYADDYKKIDCSAIIVQGVSDFNVFSYQAQAMYNAFKKADQNVKLILHQDGHNNYFGKYIDDQLSDEIYNKWLCHYLYDVDNEIESMSEVNVQSNVDGNFYTYDSWGDVELSSFKAKDASGEHTISSTNLTPLLANGVQDENYLLDMDDNFRAVYEFEIPEGSVISGTAQVHLRLSTQNVDQDNLMVSAVLMDEMKDGSAFEAYQINTDNRYRIPTKTIDTYKFGENHDDGKIVEFVKSYTHCHAISYGFMDLLDPEAGKEPSLDTKYHTAKAGEYSDYTLVFSPTEYTLQKGHVLKLYVYAKDPDRGRADISKKDYLDMAKGDEVYSFAIDNASIEVELPIRD